MTGRKVGADPHQLAPDDLEPLLLEPVDDLSAEPALDRVRLENDEGGFHGGAREGRAG